MFLQNLHRSHGQINLQILIHFLCRNISKYLLTWMKMSGVTMKLGLDENGELKVMPDFHSVFDARFALSQYVSIPTDYPIAMRTGLVLPPVSAVYYLFIKNGNRQKYVTIQNVKGTKTAENPAAYHRKIQEENDNLWAWPTAVFTLGQDVRNIGYFL